MPSSLAEACSCILLCRRLGHKDQGWGPLVYRIIQSRVPYVGAGMLYGIFLGVQFSGDLG